jgi:S-DNA-T family DNA segregation ATPase FtsK/SpoIIIE
MRRIYFYEAFFVIFAILTVFLSLSLLSYSPEDPSYSNIVFSRYDESVHNIFGKAGAYAADIIGTAFGWSSVFLPFLGLVILAQTIKLYRESTTFKRAFTVLLLSVILIALLSILSGIVGEGDPYFADKKSGGVFGVAGAVVLSGVLGAAGGAILCVVFLLVGGLWLTRISVLQVIKFFAAKIAERRERPLVRTSERTKEKEGFFARIARTYKERRAAALREREREKFIEEHSRKAEAVDENEPAVSESAAQAQQQPQSKIPITFAPIRVTPPAITPPPPVTASALSDTRKKEIPVPTPKAAEEENIGLITEIPNPPPNPTHGELNEEPYSIQSASYSENAPHTEKQEPRIGVSVTELEELISKHGEAEALKSIGSAPYSESTSAESIFFPEAAREEKKPVYHIPDIYQLPLELLDPPPPNNFLPDERELEEQADLLLSKLRDFSVDGRIKEIHQGPVVTTFELELAPGIKIATVARLENDMAMALSADSVRIIAPIPGKGVVGIEVPNRRRAMVTLRELLEDPAFQKHKSPLAVALGKDSVGNPYFTDINEMPHLLIGGTTNSGKSVCVNAIICSILYKSSPDTVKFVLIDPKIVELSVYEGIPHLLTPVVTDTRKAAVVLDNVVKEMESRYALLARHKVRNIASYNAIAEQNPDVEPMRFIVVIVDEFADLMMVVGKEVENAVIRIAQKARAVGIHLLLATQRPSVNVITGIIKANMPSRISFKVSSMIDSRTILDQNGAEMLLGRGDSLFKPQGSGETIRVHGSYVSGDEVLRVVEALKTYGEPEYNMELLVDPKQDEDYEDEDDEEESDEKYKEALQLVREKGFASISMVQRHLNIGYPRAGRIVDKMDRQGYLEPSDGTSKPRKFRER